MLNPKGSKLKIVYTSPLTCELFVNETKILECTEFTTNFSESSKNPQIASATLSFQLSDLQIIPFVKNKNENT